jgi:hypothetical protein
MPPKKATKAVPSQATSTDQQKTSTDQQQKVV